MPSVFPKTYSRPIPEGAQRVTTKIKRRGVSVEVPAVKFKGEDGRAVVAPLTADGKRCRVRSPYWYGWVNGKEVKLCTNKAAAETKLAELIKKAERQEAGLDDAFDDHRKTLLKVHVEAFRAHLRGKGNTSKHVEQVVARLQKVIDGCGFVLLKDLDAARVSDWLTALATVEAPAELPESQETFTTREVADLLGISISAVSMAVARFQLQPARQGKASELSRATVQALLDRKKGASDQTRHHYVAAVRAFGRWLVRPGRRLPSNPLDGLEAPRVVEQRHLRRELTAEELPRLLATTRTSERTFRGLTGEDRFHLYACACGTGFRAGGLAGLTPECFDLAGDVPTVTLSVRTDKSRKGKIQPLPADVADLMCAYLDGKAGGLAVWPGGWWSEHGGKGAEMLRRDLADAGIPYTVDSPDGPLHCDFHALRHTYLTLGGRAGIDLRTLQDLAGHSTSKLTERYTHIRLHDLAGAVEKLPPILPNEATSEPHQQLATGTDGLATTPVRFRSTSSQLPVPPASRGECLRVGECEGGEIHPRARERKSRQREGLGARESDGEAEREVRPAGLEPATFGSEDTRRQVPRTRQPRSCTPRRHAHALQHSRPANPPRRPLSLRTWPKSSTPGRPCPCTSARASSLWWTPAAVAQPLDRESARTPAQ
jgi:integrase